MAEMDFQAKTMAAIARPLDAANRHIQTLNQTTLQLQREIACVAAPTGAEARRAAWVESALRLGGYSCRLDSAGNVIASDSATQNQPTLAPVVCMAHLDTVFGQDTPLEAVEAGPRISCPGIGDNGRGLAAMLTIATVLARGDWQTSLLQRPVEFVATVGEEGLGNLRGARAYFADRELRGEVLPHAVVVLDGPGDENIVHHALGSRRYHIAFNGAGGHSWADFGTPNAVHAAARAASMLSEIPRRSSRRIALTVSGIGGGESMNSIPSAAWIDVDVRGTDAGQLAHVDAELRRVVQTAVELECVNAAHTGFVRNTRRATEAALPLQVSVAVVGERPCGVLLATHPLVKLAERVSSMHGVNAVSAIASTDANIPLSLGVPAITIGGGGTGGGAHTVHEWYDNTNGPLGVQRAFAILAALAM